MADEMRSPNPIPPRTSSSQHGPKPSFDATNHTRQSIHNHVPIEAVRGAEDGSQRRFWTADKEKILTAPYEYLFSHPGKDIRSKLIDAFNVWLQVPSESLAVISHIVGMLHTASLLIDDIEDSSVLRRGVPVAHSIFGVPQTINSANYIYFCAMAELRKLKNPVTFQIFTDELINLHRGQGMDLYWRDSLTCPTEEEYLDMVSNKTGGLFRLAIKLMQAESTTPKDCVALVDMIGVIFQIRDDYQNLASSIYTSNKGLCEDLTEGKFSFPIIHSIRTDPTNTQLLSILRQKPQEEEIKRYAVSYMESTGSFDYTRQRLKTLIYKAKKLVDKLDENQGGSDALKQVLDSMVV